MAIDRSGTDRAGSVLVTGGAGFLGSHLCESLVFRGHDVWCIDSLHTGRRANVAPLQESDRFHLVEHDIRNALPDGLPRFDEIYNLACPASPPHYQADPVRTLMTNALGTGNVLQRAERDGARLFQASTSEVYGDPEIHPQPESYRGNVNPVGPRSCYDEGKRFAEALVCDYARSRGVNARIVRIFNTYGPRMRADDGRVVSNFITQALRGRPLTVYGDGSQTRSFCFVSDLIRGFDLLMHCDEADEAPVNLGNPAEIAVGDLARLIVEMTGSHAPLIHVPLPVDDPVRRRPDISRARRLLGWQPQVDLAEGLARTIAHFENAISGRAAAALPAGAPA